MEDYYGPLKPISRTMARRRWERGEHVGVTTESHCGQLTGSAMAPMGWVERFPTFDAMVTETYHRPWGEHVGYFWAPVSPLVDWLGDRARSAMVCAGIARDAAAIGSPFQGAASFDAEAYAMVADRAQCLVRWIGDGHEPIAIALKVAGDAAAAARKANGEPSERQTAVRLGEFYQALAAMLIVCGESND